MMESVLRHIVEISLSAGVVIALLLLFSTRLNRTFIAKWKYWIWLLLAVRLLIPFNAVLPEAPVRLTMPERAVMPAQFQMAQEQMSVTTPAAPAQATPPQEAGGMPAWTRTELLAVLWLTGAACFLFYHLFSYLHCKRRYLRWSKPISDRRVLAMVDQLTVEMEIRQAVAPLVCDQASSFMMIGFFRHYLLLPRENLPGADLYYILKHELVHLKRGDVWYKLVLLVASAVHWFNPAVHLMFREAAKDLELACDDEVVRGLPAGHARAYSESLLAEAHRGQMRGTALSTYFRGSTKTLSERFRNLLGAHPRRRGFAAGGLVILCTALAGVVVACTSAAIPDLGDLDALTRQYLLSPFMATMLNEDWDDPEELDPESFVYYYASYALIRGDDTSGWHGSQEYNALIPAEELEPGVQAHFDVTTEFLRSSDAYIADENAYDFGGLGGAAEAYVTRAARKSDRVELRYDKIDALGNPLGSGALTVRFTGDSYRYTACRYEEAASYTLTFPSADNIVVTDNAVVMLSGGQVSQGHSPDAMTEYDGGDLDSIKGFYMDEALPELGAQGSEILENDTWVFEGNDKDNKPLRIDVTPFDEQYIIHIVFDKDEVKKIAPFGPIVEAVPKNLYDLQLVSRAYVWPLIHCARVAGYSWNSPAEIDADDLINICAYNNLLELPVEPADRTIFQGAEYVEHEAPAAQVESALRKHFDVSADYLKTASQYHPETDTYTMYNGWGGGWAYMATAAKREGDRIVINVGISNPDNDEIIPCSVLTVEVKDSVLKFISNQAVERTETASGASRSDAEIISLADSLMRQGNEIFWWYHSDYPDTLDLDTDEGNWIQGDWQTYAKVGRFATMAELKRATEAVFTREFCESHFYDKVNDNQKFHEIDGVLYHNLQSGGMGWIFGLPKEYSVKTAENDTIVLNAICDGLDNRPGNDGETEYEFEIMLTKIDGEWRLNSWYTYNPHGWDSVEISPRDPA